VAHGRTLGPPLRRSTILAPSKPAFEQLVTNNPITLSGHARSPDDDTPPLLAALAIVAAQNLANEHAFTNLWQLI
jgi:hypothetical protein